MKNILITGGLGFLGGHLIERLLSKEKYTVINIDKITYASRTDFSFRSRVNYYSEQNTDLIHLETIPENTDIIVHCAAETHVDTSFTNPKIFFDSNVFGTFQLLEAVRKLPKQKRPCIIYMSTDEVYGDTGAIVYDESMNLMPSNPYAATKAAAEQLFHAWASSYNIPFVILRNTNNYGPDQNKEKFIPLCFESLRKDSKIPIHGDGTQRRTWIHVDDTLDAIEHIIDSDIKNEVFNVSGPENYSILEVASFIANAFSKDFKKVIYFTSNRLTQDMNYQIDGKKLMTTGWTPKRRLNDFIKEYAQDAQ